MLDWYKDELIERKKNKPKIRKLTKKLLLVPGTEAIEEQPFAFVPLI